MPTTVSGPLHPSNKNCIDWSEKGLIAFASHSIVNIIDPWTKQRIQVLENHASAICELHWCSKTSLEWNEEEENESRLASADIGGLIVICDALMATVVSQFRLTSATVLSMSWFTWKDGSRDFLLVLHSKGTLVLWNADTGDKVWQHSYSVPASLSFLSIDPFEPRRIAVCGTGMNVFVSGEIALTNPTTSPLLCIPLCSNSGDPATNSHQTVSISSLSFHKAYRNQLFACAEVTLYIIDAEVGVVLCRTALDSSASLLLPLSLRDALFIVHTNGSLAFRIGKLADGVVRSDEVCLSEGGRVSGQKKAVAAVLCPATEATVALLHANGRLSLWQLEAATTRCSEYRSYTIEDVVSIDENLQTNAMPNTRLRQSGCVFSLTAAATILRVRPLLTEGEDVYGRMQLGIIGTNGGSLHLVDVFTARVIREWTVQSSPIKMGEWAGSYEVVTAGFNHALSSTCLVRNDLCITDIRTGSSRSIRPVVDESPISLLRLSHYRCYMAIAFQSDPMEIWQLKTFRLLRKMSKTCPLIVDLAWSCKHHGVRYTEKLSVYRENLVVLDSENRLYHVVVKGLHVRDGKEVNTQWKGGGWQLRGMAWKDDLLALGDADGRLVLWDLSRRQSREARAARSPPLRMAFSSLPQDHTLTVLHQREVLVWDAESLTLSSRFQLDPWRSALDMDLCGLSAFIIGTDNTISIASGATSRPVPENDMPILYGKNSRRRELLVACWSTVKKTPELSTAEEKRSPLLSLRALSARRPLEHRMHRESSYFRFLGLLPSHSLLLLISNRLNGVPQELPPHLELFWPSDQLRKREEELVKCVCRLPSNTLSAKAQSVVIERAVVLGGKAREAAVDLLIAGGNELVHSSLKAALLVSQQESEHSKSLIKLIATNLIASDHIHEGMEMLLLVGAGGDACKYMQSQRMWQKSVLAAKMALNEEQAMETIQRWISHLQMDQKSTCAMAMASVGEWKEAEEVIRGMGNNTVANLLHSIA